MEPSAADAPRAERRHEALARLHGAYYLASGVWPLVSLRTFERITGPKTDDWLVRTVGLLAAVIGATLVRHGGRHPGAARDLAVASATAFAAVDAWYVARGRIAPVYLLDALVEAGLVAAWLRPGRARTASAKTDARRASL